MNKCVLRGCVPKKLLVYASKYTHEFEDSHGFGWKYDTEPSHDWSTLIANKNAELQRLTGIYKNILNNANVKLIEGRGKVIDPHTVDVDGKIYTTRNILIAVGGRPFIPDIPGREFAIDSDAALDLPSKPKKIAIVGGGYIALEFAGIFNGLNSEVHVFIRQKKVLRGFDEDVRDFVGEQMSLRGIEFHTEESPEAIIKAGDGSFSLKTSKGTVDGFSHVMFATGRKPNTKNLGLENVGVKLAKNGAIEVDEYSRTSVPSIYAVGDVTDRINLTPVALMEGMALAKTLFQNDPTKPDYRAVPCAVFSQPPIGTVGLTEEQAIEQYGDIDVFTSNFKPLKATLSGLPDRVFMKLIVCANTNKVLGVHMCGEDSPEIIQGFGVAVKAGLTKADFDATVGVHPTAAEEFVTMRTPTRKIRKESSEAAATRSLEKGTNLDSILDMLDKVLPELSCPVSLFTYYNPILKRGLGKFMSSIRDVGVQGLVVPDVPLEETEFLRKEALNNSIELVLLTTPTTPTERMKRIVDASEGFIYLVSSIGVTGARASVSGKVQSLLKDIKEATDKPVAVGFGISKPEHVKQIAGWGADGVIVGSAMVRLLGDAKSPAEGLKELESLTKSLKSALL
ncbi:hypothetical protein F2Q69_00061837 [Brassica cretica]|uniref:Tryptophan synthase n=1 Tax=Brassica cretica TaxID=69181 RepID=A0A8S9RLG0_BRACR|nr:hypothetical protein F2Q69_00061837 [Brassica cretica]